MPIDIDAIRQRLTTNFIGQHIDFIPTLKSTNSWCLDRAKNNGQHGDVVITDEQSAGRGRVGRSWFSPAGRNLYLSILLKPDTPGMESSLITLVTGLAAAHALIEQTSLPVQLKWPNDLILAGRKLGGILCEAHIQGNELSCLVVGIGINVNTSIEDWPTELKQTATSLEIALGKPQQREELAAGLLNEFEACYQRFSMGEWPKMLTQCNEWNILRDQPVTVDVGQESYEATAREITDNGHLVIETKDGKRQGLIAGDVQLRLKD